MRYLILDIEDILSIKNQQTPPLFYSVQGVNIRLSQDRLKMLRAALKAHPKMQVVLAPASYTKLSLKDYRIMFKTFNIDPERILMVDTSLFGQEEEMAQIFRIQEFLMYHRRSHEDYKFLISSEDVHKATKLKYLQAHMLEMYLKTSEVELDCKSLI